MSCIDLEALRVLPSQKNDDFLRRFEEIEKAYEERFNCFLDLIVGFCVDRARDAYILGMSDVCSFLSGKSLEEALSIMYEKRKPHKKIPDFCNLVEWARGCILDSTHANLAHEVREKRNDYGHAFLKILQKKLEKSPNRRPFADSEALDTYQKTVRVLTYIYKK